MTEQKTILLVEDDPLIIRMYQNKLSADGYNVETAFNGEEGLTKIRKQKPDLILLDVMMPRMNGIEVLKNLKENDDTKDIPVIFLTNLGDNEEDIEKAKDMGATDYLVKSEISLSDLSEKVKEFIS
ncbi:MAG: response regulator [Candidatus Spechtbacterales bacterium]|nr:response regulator [Candidatus Spechtbacterales bacterium]